MTVKAAILAAGYGTRFLPVTRVVPKELLPIVARPAIDLVVAELVEAGVTDLLVITSRRKQAVEAWFDRDPELEATFGAERASAKLAAITPPSVRTTFVRQPHMGGTGHALRLARTFAGDDPLLVAFPDDLFGGPNASRQLLDLHARTGCAVLGAVDLSGQDVSRYGVISAREVDGVLRVDDVVEKPTPGTEPSHLVSVGRYLYTPAMLDALDSQPGERHGGELTPMAAMRHVARRDGLVAAALRGPRWDVGTPLGYLQAVVDHALDTPELAEAFDAWLRSRLDGGGPHG